MVVCRVGRASYGAHFVIVSTSSTPRAAWFRDSSLSGASAELAAAFSSQGALLPF